MNSAENKTSFVTDHIGANIKMASHSKEAIELAGLNYEVGINPATVNINGKNKTIPYSYATFRKDTEEPFGTVGSKYKVVQNEKMFNIADNLLDMKKADFISAGTLERGRKAFMTIRLTDEDIIMPDSNDIVEFRLILSTSHDGSQSLKIAFMPIRMICSNGMIGEDRKNASYYTLRHTQNIDNQIRKVSKIIAESHNFTKYINDMISNFNRINIKDTNVSNVINNLIFSEEELNLISLNNGVANNISEISTRKLNMHSNLTNSIYNGIGQEYYRGTALWLYNGITTYLSNYKNYTSYERKYNHIIESTGRHTVKKTINLINEMV